MQGELIRQDTPDLEPVEPSDEVQDSVMLFCQRKDDHHQLKLILSMGEVKYLWENYPVSIHYDEVS